MNKEQFETFKSDVRKNVKRETQKALRWVDENREFVVVVAPIIIGGSIKIAQIAMRRHNLNLETQHRELFVYDRSLGHYWQLRRKLTNNEWVSIESRRKAGESLAQILSSLKLLK